MYGSIIIVEQQPILMDTVFIHNAYMGDNVVPINHHDESPLQLQSYNTVAIF